MTRWTLCPARPFRYSGCTATKVFLAGLHLRDVALVEHDPAHQLHVEEADPDRAPERLPHGRVGLEDQLLEGLPVLEPLPELRGLALELSSESASEVGLEVPM